MAKSADPFLPADIPLCLRPVYETATVNHPITLYEGDISLEQESRTFTGSGRVLFEWLARPGLRFDVELPQDNMARLELASCTLHMLGTNRKATASVMGIAASSSKGVHEIKGMLEEFEVGRDEKLSFIIFHIVNFTDYLGRSVRDENRRKTWAGRSVIEVDPWRITLDKIEDAKKLFNELGAIGGYAITHVGKLERLDGKKFAAKLSAKVFEALFRYLSFCRGAWVAPILPIGFDENGDRTWERWRDWKIERWKHVPNWFNSHAEEGLSGGFPGFFERWQDENWTEALLLSNHWYVEANMSAGGVEGGIILAQSAIEVLGWTHLVAEKSALSEKGYEKLDAVDKLRLLMSIWGIPTSIPVSLPELAARPK